MVIRSIRSPMGQLRMAFTCDLRCTEVCWRIPRHGRHASRNLHPDFDLGVGLHPMLLGGRPREIFWTALNHRLKGRPWAGRILVFYGGNRSAGPRGRLVGQLWGGEGDPHSAWYGRVVNHGGQNGIRFWSPIPKSQNQCIAFIVWLMNCTLGWEDLKKNKLSAQNKSFIQGVPKFSKFF